MSEQILRPLFESYTGQKLSEIQELPASGSNRRYFRLKGGDITLIGAVGANLQENHSFIYLARHFKEKRLRVPTVLAVNEDLVMQPETVNADPYGKGWLIRIRPDDPDAVSSLLDLDGYESLLPAED